MSPLVMFLFFFGGDGGYMDPNSFLSQSGIGNGSVDDFTTDPALWVPPGTTPQWMFGPLRDANGNILGSSDLTTLTLTIVDTDDPTVIINSVNHVDILNTGRGVVNPFGLITITLEPTDTALVVPTHSREYFSLVMSWTYQAGARAGRHMANIMIAPLAGVT